MLKLTPEARAEKFETMFIEFIGGQGIVDLLCDHHLEGLSLRDLGRKHGAPHRTIHQQIVVAHMKLRRLGLMPENWERTNTKDDTVLSANFLADP
jgi:hypothetical protein